MTNEQFLFTLFCTVVFCLGLNMTLSEGNIFYFIRKPFEGLYDEIENKVDLYKTFKPDSVQVVEFYYMKIKYFILKPTILCITCMASIWGVAMFVTLNGFANELIPYLIINSFAASFIQTFIWNLYVRVSNQ